MEIDPEDPFGSLEIASNGNLLVLDNIFLDSFFLYTVRALLVLDRSAEVEIEMPDEPNHIFIKKIGRGVELSYCQKSILCLDIKDFQLAFAEAGRYFLSVLDNSARRRNLPIDSLADLRHFVAATFNLAPPGRNQAKP